MFITSHSPNISSKVDLENIIICKGGLFHSLRRGQTLLNPDDYNFLERFLDVTKSDLFFAKGIIFVEGIAEALLLPVIAKVFDIDLNKLGISIINLNGLSFDRYTSILLQEKNGRKCSYLGIKIACITDRDLRKNINIDRRATEKEFSTLVISGGINEGSYPMIGPRALDEEKKVKIFYNRYKTLEYDMGLGSFFDDLLEARKKVQGIQNEYTITAETDAFKKSYLLYEKIGSIKGETAQQLAKIWEQKLLNPPEKVDLRKKLNNDPHIQYLIQAIEHTISPLSI